MKRKEEFHHSRSLKSLWFLCSHQHHQKSFSSTYLVPPDKTGTNGTSSDRSNVSLEFPMMRWLLMLFTDCYWDTLVVVWSQEAIEQFYLSTMNWKSPQIQHY